MKKIKLSLFALIVFAISSFKAYSHCEIPCGIFDDSVRVALIYEHITTIEKSMVKIKELEAADKVDYNQLVRWVMNKEEHALEIQHIVSQYFLHQRVKIVDETDGQKAFDKQFIWKGSMAEVCSTPIR